MATGPSIPYHVLKSQPDTGNGTNTSSSSSTSPANHRRNTTMLHNNTTSTGKKGRVSLAKAVILVSVSFMMLALVHINYTSSYYDTPESQETHTSLDEQTQQPLASARVPQIHPEPILPETKTPPPTKEPAPGTPDHETNKSDSDKGSEDPKAHPQQDDPGLITSDTDLSTTIHYANGTEAKIFKPAFFKNAEAAKKDMGSFMQTLATRSWLVQEPAASHDKDNDNDNDNQNETEKEKEKENENEDEEEEDDDRDQKDASTQMPSRYFTYLPMGGGNNQFTALQKAAILAKDLDRTLILPPISPNSHIPVWAGPRYSQFYDLESFISKSGISVLEWHDIKQAPETVPGDFKRHWEEFSEDLPCVPNGNIGVSKTSLYDKFRQQFLLKYRMTIPKEDITQGKSTDFKFVRDVLLKDTPVTTTTTPSTDGIDPNMWKCLSCPYFLGGPELGARTWKEVGVHLRFNDKTEAMVDDILDVLLGPIPEDKDDKETTTTDLVPSAFRPHPEFIIIHLRRGDIVSKCPKGQKEEECIVQIEAIADKVDSIEKDRRNAALAKHKGDKKDFVYKKLPVLVTTNEQRPEELQKLDTLGWILLDHGDEEKGKDGQVKASKTKKLGTMSRLGPWYPPMLDAVLLTRGDYLIGMQNSRMSILATQRGAAWHGHKTMLM